MFHAHTSQEQNEGVSCSDTARRELERFHAHCERAPHIERAACGIISKNAFIHSESLFGYVEWVKKRTDDRASERPSTTTALLILSGQAYSRPDGRQILISRLDSEVIQIVDLIISSSYLFEITPCKSNWRWMRVDNSVASQSLKRRELNGNDPRVPSKKKQEHSAMTNTNAVVVIG